jgi:hypothetical protein
MDWTNMINRRSFIRNTGLAAVSGVAPRLSFGRNPSLATRKVHLTVETGGPAYVEVRGPQGAMYQPCGAVMDRTALTLHQTDRYYLGHFTSLGSATLDLPVGRYTIIVENGLEFQRVELVVDLMADQTVHLIPERWTHMASKGWWSGDFHIHRPPEDAELLLKANDLNFAVFFTMWNNYSFWEGKELPADPTVRADSQHIATLMNAEDERGGGAWLMHNLRKPIVLSQAERWYPQGSAYIDQAKAQGGWFDCEKPFWWEAPVMAALEPIDSMGIVHNHYNKYGTMAYEAWGRPRDQMLYPGDEGFSNYCQDIYYRYLNLGKRYPVSAGSASGVLSGPPGYNRIYVYAPEGLTVDSFYSALKAGRNFATNGPMLTLSVDGKTLGDDVEVQPGRRLQVTAEAQAREPIDHIDILANGRIVASTVQARLEAEIESQNYTWLAARCILKSEGTVRFAHTSPIFLHGKQQHWDASEDREYFVRWIDDLMDESKADTKRFSSDDHRNQILAVYRTARDHYA